MKRKIIVLFLAFVFMLALCACNEEKGKADAEKTISEKNNTEQKNETKAIEIVDYYGNTVSFNECPKRVIALSGSFGEMWLDAGGSLVGITDDALSERNIELGEEVTIVGTVKKPNLELILELEPDFVILSADIASHLEAAQSLDDIGIKHGSFHVELFEDYLELLEVFTSLTGRDDMFEKNGLEVQRQIEETLKKTEKFDGSTALLIRAYSTGWKAKDSTTLAGAIISDFGFENIIERYDSSLEQLSLEEIAAVDPDYVFVTIMGSNIEGTMQMLNEQLESNPVWQGLKAIKAEHFFVLPQELFHFKPNSKWGEAYSYMADILNQTR